MYNRPVYLILVSLISRWRLFPRDPAPFSHLEGSIRPLSWSLIRLSDNLKSPPVTQAFDGLHLKKTKPMQALKSSARSQASVHKTQACFDASECVSGMSFALWYLFSPHFQHGRVLPSRKHASRERTGSADV